MIIALRRLVFYFKTALFLASKHKYFVLKNVSFDEALCFIHEFASLSKRVPHERQVGRLKSREKALL